jgi:hypothetical protein
MKSAADRAFAAIPVALIGVAVLTLYAVEAWSRKTPWVFTDEAEWTQISRSIASTGHAARRGQPIYFKSLYAFLLAPFWWIHSTATAYAAIKYMNAVVMTLAAIPTYLLARMLVTRRAAVAVGLLAVLIPGMGYATSIVPEVLAYPWYALCSWLIVRALTTKRRLDYAIAIAAAIVAGLIRWPQFATVPASFVIAYGVIWFNGPRGRAMRAGWSRSDYIGAIALFAGAMILFNRVVLQHEQIWQVSTQYLKSRMLDLGLKAALALTIGMGILPVVGGLVSLRLRERRDQPAYRAFAAYLAASIICISLYTAVKAAFLSTVFSTLTEERNMIYLSPMLLVGTALVFEARRLDWRLVTVASAFVLWLIYAKPANLLFPYFEAPGFGILDVFTRHFQWTIQDLRLALALTLAVAVIALCFRHVRGVAAVLVVVGAAWMLTSEIAATVGADTFATQFRNHLPKHLNWIDLRTHGAPVTYLGQEVVDPNGVLLTEFWNRSLKHVDSLDGSCCGPGPFYAPNILRPDGLLSGMGDVPYVVSDNGIWMQGQQVASWKQLTLYKRRGPWRLLAFEQQVYSDSWAPGWSTYTYFRPKQRGTMVVHIGRRGYTGDAPAGDAVIQVGTMKVVADQARIGHVYATVRQVVANGSDHVIRIPVAQTPLRVVITIKHTIPPSVDPRNLGAQVAFNFVPAKHR